MWRITKLLYTLLYLLSSVYWLSFWRFQKKSYRHVVSDKLIEGVYVSFFAVFCVTVLVNHFTGFSFTVLPDGAFVIRSPLLFYMVLASILLYVTIALLTVCPTKTKLILLSYSVFPLLAWLPVYLLPYSPFYTDVFSGVCNFADLIPLYLLFFSVYLENGRRFFQRERDMAESRANAMALKISPHFISNTMSSIVALSNTDTARAGDLAAKFARYLRDNYVEMTNEPMISFAAELEHIQNYLAVEQVRFPNLRVAYNVQADRFLLPTLTVQPLVENAVRHGISKKPDASGTVMIASFEDENDYVIRIEDDGIGYHPTPDGKKHVGVANAKTRRALLTIDRSGGINIFDRDGRPVNIRRSRTQQLFELLLEQNGRSLTARELCERMWQDGAQGDYLKSKNENYITQLLTDLRHTLKDCGAQDVFRRTADGYAVCMPLIDLIDEDEPEI